MNRLRPLFVLLSLLLLCQALQAQDAQFDPQKLKAHIEYLAGEPLHGRRAGTADERLAAEYISQSLEAAEVAAPPAGRIHEFVFKNGADVLPLRSANVLGWIEGADPQLREQVIVVGAHYDHLGINAGKVHPGADDNASGTALVMEVAAAAAANRHKLGRSLLFVFFGSEEIGLLGSEAFVQDCPIDLQRIVAMLNVDMIGRPFMDQSELMPVKRLAFLDSKNTIAVLGVSARPLFSDIAGQACRDAGITAIGTQKIPFIFQISDQLAHQRSDHTAFEDAGIPTMFFCSGESDDYHRSTDTADKIDGPIVAQRAQAVFNTTVALSNAPAAQLPAVQNVRLPDGEAAETLTLTGGALQLLLRDNRSSPGTLSGIDALYHQQQAPEFDAFDPDTLGASAGLNFEHIIAGRRSEDNRFEPRHGRYPLYSAYEGQAAVLIRRREDSRWRIASRLQYTVTAPHYIDFDFRCTNYDPALLGERGFALFFFANYMNDVISPEIHFRGVERAGAAETWISADAPPGDPRWDQGGTYIAADAQSLEYDADHNFTLNLWNYDYPRFTQPFYYGRAANEMVFLIMFDRARTAEDEIRFSLFKFKLPQRQRPAWDFQYVVRQMQPLQEYGFRGRMVWKRWVSPADCLLEYEQWRDSLATEATIESDRK